MIDIHSHILPGMDDGARDWEAALAMARDAAADGISMIIATPHHANGQFDTSADDIRQAVLLMNGKLRKEPFDLTVAAGQEIRVYERLLDDLEKGKLLTLAQSRYILLEMPSSRIPSRMAEVCHELLIQGLVPVIAHPERNAEVSAHPERLERLIEAGAYGQLTAQCVTGGLGNKLQKLSLDLCRRGAVHLIASDAHDCGRRPFGLSEAYRIVEKQLGTEACDIFRDNASAVWNNGDIVPIPVTKKRVESSFFGKFFRKG